MEGLAKYPCTVAKWTEDSITINCEGNYYDIAWGFVADQEGRPYPLSRRADLKIGEGLDLFVQNNTIQRVEVKLAPPIPIMILRPPVPRKISKEISNAYLEGVRYYSLHVFPLELLKNEYSFTPSSDSLFELMQTEVVGIRKCNAGDSNAVYNVMSIAYIEHLARRSTPMSEVEHLQRRLGAEYRVATRTLADLAEVKKSDHCGMTWLTQHNRNSELWQEMMDFLRQLVTHANIAGLTPIMITLISLGEENNDISLSALATAFSLKIIVFSTEIDQMKSAYTKPDADGDLAKIYLFRAGGLFHILYSQAQLETEGYDLNQCRLNPRPGSADISKLYSKPQQRDVIPSRLMEDCDLARASLSKLPDFSDQMQHFIKCFMDLIERKRAFENVNDFLKEDLVNESLEMMYAFSNYFEEIRDFPGRTVDGFVDEVLGKLMEAPLQSVLSRREWFESMSVCSYCHRDKGKVIMDCRHAFCQKCIGEYAERKQADLQLLKANGETVEEFVCPMMNCFVRIPGAKLKVVLGEHRFAELLQKTEQVLGRRFCYKCRKARAIQSFVQLCPCNDPMCQMCYCDSVRKSDGKCSCGLPLSAEASKAVTELTAQCANCFKVKSSLREFTSVECEEHILCEDCLATTFKNNKRCPLCFRFFASQECMELKFIMREKKCMFCGKECRKSRLNTTCGCVICEKCAIEQVTERHEYLNCFNCRALLPGFGTNQLHLWTDLNPQEAQLDCTICFEPIEKTEEATLSCQHTFHVACIGEFIKSLVRDQDYSDSEVPCPNSNCRVLTSANIIAPFVDPETFQKYYDNFIAVNTTPCPRCQARIPHQDSNGGKKPSLLCTNCSFSFCVSCRGESKASHDEKSCKFNKIEQLVADAENHAKIVAAEAVGQCPNCKHPAVKGEGCDSVVCPSCKENFCVICSVPSYLIEQHGGAWHRPACSRYVRQGPTAGMSTRCRACVLRGALCEPPRDLKVRGRFAFDES